MRFIHNIAFIMAHEAIFVRCWCSKN